VERQVRRSHQQICEVSPVELQGREDDRATLAGIVYQYGALEQFLDAPALHIDAKIQQSSGREYRAIVIPNT
jgi:hypothetical protein